MKKRYKLLGGKHNEDGRDYDAKDPNNCVVTSSKPLLDMFPNKFIEVSSAGQPLAPAETEETPEQKAERLDTAEAKPAKPEGKTKTVATSTANVTSELGDNVTDHFSKAVEADLRVFKHGSSYYVTEPGLTDKALNKTALKLGAVEDFIEKLLK